jgi:hypothetical protein
MEIIQLVTFDDILSQNEREESCNCNMDDGD